MYDFGFKGTGTLKWFRLLKVIEMSTSWIFSFSSGFSFIVLDRQLETVFGISVQVNSFVILASDEMFHVCDIGFWDIGLIGSYFGL
ncbi:hypothetical protein GLOIN_2v1470006 [Rhizophagus irregularis DAOM 181602=DAOM 197198]|nr:hypothetical protein GLOIN_2v1470006 [Rhizophagus irregularis DAOM 181602=DAOM 197198]